MIALHNFTRKAFSSKKKIKCEAQADVSPLGSRASPSTEREARGMKRNLKTKKSGPPPTHHPPKTINGTSRRGSKRNPITI